ncbi:MAG: glycosyltransferase [Actinomycetota bacterium]|nr:glycosyltransferase [Actinomycetota bacterium]
MRILIVHNRYRSSAPSGENHVVDVESEALRDAGHDVSSFERQSDDIATWSIARRATVPVSVVSSRRSRIGLAEVISRSRPDVVHVHNTFPLLSPSILHAAADAAVPIVVSIHNYRLACPSGDFFRREALCYDCVGTSGLRAIARGCYRGSAPHTAPIVASNRLHREAWQTLPSAYIFVSEAERRALISLSLPEDRTFVKWNLVPWMSAPAVEVVDRVTYVGRLVENKGIRVLLDAWSRYRAVTANPRLRLTIVGGGPLEQEVRSRAGEDDRIDFRGFLEPSTCRSVVAGSLAVVVPSVWPETFGLVAVEAMSAGVAVVASAIGALPELVRPDVEGALFAPGDPAGLARILEDIDARPERWRRLGHSGRRSYQRRFDPAENLDQLVRIYEFAVKSPRVR